MVRKLLQAALGIRDADLDQQFQRPFIRLGCFHVSVSEQCFSHLPAHGEDRIERGHGFLKNHRDVTPAHITDFRVA